MVRKFSCRCQQDIAQRIKALDASVNEEPAVERERLTWQVSANSKKKKKTECRRRLLECFGRNAHNRECNTAGNYNNCVESKKRECSWSHYGIKAIPFSPQLASG